jgi:hypothetical protein
MLEIQIPVRLDLFFLSDPDPWKSYDTSKSIGLRVVGSENPDFTSLDARLHGPVGLNKWPIYIRKKCSRTLVWPKLLLHRPISTAISWHCLFKLLLCKLSKNQNLASKSRSEWSEVLEM